MVALVTGGERYCGGVLSDDYVDRHLFCKDHMSEVSAVKKKHITDEILPNGFDGSPNENSDRIWDFMAIAKQNSASYNDGVCTCVYVRVITSAWLNVHIFG